MRIPAGRRKWFIPTTWSDVVRRSLTRIVCCSLVFLAVAYALSAAGDSRLLSGLWWWYIVLVIPGLGCALDLWRLRETQRRTGRG